MSQAIVYISGDSLVVSYLSPSMTISIEEAAAAVVPTGVAYRVIDTDSLPPDSTYRNAWTANFDDNPCVVTIDPSKVDACDKAAELAQVEEWFRSAIDEGFASDDGIRLGLSDSDITLLTGNYVLAREAAVLGLPLPAVIDRKGVAHELDITELTALMLAYGQHRARLSAEYAAQKAALGG